MTKEKVPWRGASMFPMAMEKLHNQTITNLKLSSSLNQTQMDRGGK